VGVLDALEEVLLMGVSRVGAALTRIHKEHYRTRLSVSYISKRHTTIDSALVRVKASVCDLLDNGMNGWE